MKKLVPGFPKVVAALVLFAAGSTAAESPRPNIVFIVADDLGYMDLGVNHPQTFYETPAIDGLAQRGMRFTSGYAACPVCSPTRASIMTGQWPARVGITNFIPGHRPGKLLSAPFKHALPLEEVTIAEALRDAGYATFFAGKWHLGTGDYSPNAQGFGPGLAVRGQLAYPGELPDFKSNADPKTTDRIAADAVRFIEHHKARPFFACLAFQAAHIPIGARQELIEKYERKKTNAPPDKWGHEGANKVRLVQNQAAYAAMLEQMDSAVGHVLAALDRAALAERTIVVFTSDNGGLSTAEGFPTANFPLRAGKGWLYEGGIRVPWIICAPGVTQPNSVCDMPVVSNDFYPTLLELAGLPPLPRQHRDGVSLVPLLKGQSLERGPLFWHYPHNSNQGGGPGGAVREGDWKFIEWYEGRYELFNLRDDPGETRNVVRDDPARAQELCIKLATWRSEIQATMPKPNPEWRTR